MGSRDDKDHRSHCGAGVGSHQSEDEPLGENGHSVHDHRHSSHGGAGFYHDNRHGEENIHGLARGDRSHLDKVGEQGNESGLGREGYPVGSVTVSRFQAKEGVAQTSATQVTRTPLNSRPSSFSTAVLRSAAVSNSTKLLTLLAINWSECERKN